MNIKFLVLFAVICLSIHLSTAHKPAKAEGKPEKTKKHAKPEEFEYEEVEVVHHKKAAKAEAEKKHNKKEVKKEVRKKHGHKLTCVEQLADDKINCETKDVPAGYKGVFTWTEKGDECDWNCDYVALPETLAAAKHVKKAKKVKKAKAEKPKKKECSGEQIIKFSNCLVKIKGLIAWGDKTQNFDKKFAKLVARKGKKGKKGKKH